MCSIPPGRCAQLALRLCNVRVAVLFCTFITQSELVNLAFNIELGRPPCEGMLGFLPEGDFGAWTLRLTSGFLGARRPVLMHGRINNCMILHHKEGPRNTGLAEELARQANCTANVLAFPSTVVIFLYIWSSQIAVWVNMCWE